MWFLLLSNDVIKQYTLNFMMLRGLQEFGTVMRRHCFQWNHALQHGHPEIHLFFIRTPNFLPRLDVLIFSAISASYVLIHVLKCLTIIIRNLYSTTVYLILNTTVFSLLYNMKWSWKECNKILYCPIQILTQIQKKNSFT